MNQAWPAAPTAEEAKDMETTLRHYLAEMQNINREMARDQQEIDLLKAETRASLKNIHVIMDRLKVG